MKPNLEPIGIRELMGKWEIFQDLADHLNVPSNHEVQKLVREALRRRDASLARRISFDSEADRFCAMAENREDIEQVVALIEELMPGSAKI
jgi:hypothetical protein